MTDTLSRSGKSAAPSATMKDASGGAASAPAAPAPKADVKVLAKALKSNVRNGAVCRETLLQLHARIFEEGTRDGFLKFILNANGGVAALLATIENHVNDPSYLELALVFLCNLMHFGGRRNPRVVVKVVKKGGSRICLSILNKHSNNMRVVHPATMAVIALASMDSKIQVQARLGTLGTLLNLIKSHASLPREGLASVLSCLCSLSRGEANLIQLGKKGSILVLLEVCSKHVRVVGSPVLRWVLVALHQLCGLDDNAKEAAREGAVTLALHAIYEQGSSIEIQKTVLDLIKLLMRYPEGMQQFTAAGGYPYIVSVIIENNADKEDAALLDIVVQLYRFFGVIDLPIGSDNDQSWSPPEGTDEARGAPTPGAGADEDAVSAATSDTGGGGAESGQAAAATAAAGWDGEVFSPELIGGIIDGETALNPDTIVVQSVKPVKDKRPSASCVSAIDFAPPIEELLVQVPSQRVDIVRQELRRVANPAAVIHRVVFDDLPRNATMPSNALNAACAGSSKIPTLRFTSAFESGNLKRAIQVFDNEYDLILNNDVNTGSYCQWFYFGVEGMRADVTYKFNIINMEKPSSSFDIGQRPLLFSEKRFTWSGFGWLRTGHNIAYLKNSYRRRVAKRRKSSDARGNYFTLTFSVRFPHDDDRAYLANSYPYTYTDLLAYLKKKQSDARERGMDCFMMQSLCDTQGGNPMPLLTITSLSKNGVPCTAEEIKKRHVCVVSARVHPGETGASYCAKGLIDYLMDQNEVARWMRDNMVWKIVPMLNPDGVIAGNHRCALSGHDLNREFIRPTPQSAPTVFYLKELIKHMKVNEGRTVMLYGDFHGHSRRDNFFVYSCGANKKLEVHGLTVERVFPKLLSELSPYFTYSGSSFKVQRSKETTGRVVFYRQLGVRMSYTLEGSMMGGDECDFLPVAWDETSEEAARRVAKLRQTRAHFNPGHYATMGAMFAKAAKLVSQAALEGEGRVVDIIYEMLCEIVLAKQGKSKSAAASPAAAAAAAVSGAAAAMPTPPIGSPVAAQESVAMGSDAEPADNGATFSGTYASNRRGSVRVTAKGAALRKVNVNVSAADVQDVLGTMMKNVPTAKSVEHRSRSAASAGGGNDSDDDEAAGGGGDEDEDEDDESGGGESSGESSVEEGDDGDGDGDEDLLDTDVA